MSSRSLTRATFLAALVSATALAIAPNAHAARNADAERYVQENASAALRTLGDHSMSAAQRRRRREPRSWETPCEPPRETATIEQRYDIVDIRYAAMTARIKSMIARNNRSAANV